jgi:threonyl-tRNA synthetase
MLVVGKREAEEATVSIRRLGSEGQQVRPAGDVVASLVADAVPPDLKVNTQAAA